MVVGRILLFLWMMLASNSSSCSCWLSPTLQKRPPSNSRMSCPMLSVRTTTTAASTIPLLLAKKKKPKVTGTGQGFGKAISDNHDDEESGADDSPASLPTTSQSPTSSGNAPFVLESIATTSKQAESSSTRQSNIGADNNVVDNTPVAVRTQRILREKYGLKPLGEQQVDWNKPETTTSSSKLQSLEDTTDSNVLLQTPPEEEFDIMTKLPAPLLLAIDLFLKAGAAISAILFVAAGLGVTWEAWSVTSHTPLPEDIDRFIVDVVEPNFTKGLFVLLGFSVSLGLFASAQIGSQASQYRED